jgi:hypothetical protein
MLSCAISSSWSAYSMDAPSSVHRPASHFTLIHRLILIMAETSEHNFEFSSFFQPLSFDRPQDVLCVIRAAFTKSHWRHKSTPRSRPDNVHAQQNGNRKALQSGSVSKSKSPKGIFKHSPSSKPDIQQKKASSNERPKSAFKPPSSTLSYRTHLPRTSNMGNECSVLKNILGLHSSNDSTKATTSRSNISDEAPRLKPELIYISPTDPAPLENSDSSQEQSAGAFQMDGENENMDTNSVSLPTHFKSDTNTQSREEASTSRI